MEVMEQPGVGAAGRRSYDGVVVVASGAASRTGKTRQRKCPSPGCLVAEAGDGDGEDQVGDGMGFVLDWLFCRRGQWGLRSGLGPCGFD
ncbi:hypothetical protein MRB53_014185 [Persea americana]|uniref:Uncharacterized protein n=1 Tax=Persea americana TaxID=3435 RepID=A0ACC2KAL6_PERAE|nr:hypothetical protein MRB53_014185 [Persea americana]